MHRPHPGHLRKGITIRGVNNGSRLNFDVVDGFLIETVEPGSPAEKAGVRGGMLPVTVGNFELVFGGDIVASVNDTSISKPVRFEKILEDLRVGDKVKLSIYREGKYINVEFEVPERPILPGDLPGSLGGSAYMPNMEVQ